MATIKKLQKVKGQHITRVFFCSIDAQVTNWSGPEGGLLTCEGRCNQTRPAPPIPKPAKEVSKE